MKKLITTGIAGAVGAPFTEPSLDNLQDNFKEIPASIAKGLMGGYTTNDVIIWEGFVITITGGGNTATWTAGTVFYNGEFYQVASGTLTKTGGQTFLYSIVDSITNETFDDGNSYPWIEVRTITITSGTSGTGIADYGATSVKKISDQTATGFSIGSFVNCALSIAGISAVLKDRKITYSMYLIGTLTTGGSAFSAIITCPQGFKMTQSSGVLGSGIMYGTCGNTLISCPPDDISQDVKAYIDSSNNLNILSGAFTGGNGATINLKILLTRDAL